MTDLRSPLMQVAFAVYERSTGVIRRSGRAALRDVPGQALDDGEAVVKGDWPFDTAYVDLSGPAPAARMRPRFPAFDKLSIKADGQDAAEMELPIAAVVTLDGLPHDVPAGPLRIPADTPGQYSVEIAAWPYLPAHFVVEAA